MSIFSLAEFWSEKLESCQVQGRHLSVSGNNLVIGSFSGLLRAYKLGKNRDATPLIQRNYQPILQVIAQQTTLYILFLKKVTVLTDFLSPLAKSFDIQLPNNAYQMSNSQSTLLVQHQSPQLTLIEGFRLLSTVNIQHSLYPQPVPVLRSQKLLLFNVGLQLTAYRLSDIVIKNKSFCQGYQRLQVWDEPVTHEEVGAFHLIVTKSQLIQFNLNLELLRRKRLQYQVRTAFINQYQGQPVIIVANNKNTIYFYRNMCVLWAASTETPLSSLLVANFQIQKGMLVTLSDEGQFSVNFLGTSLKQPVLQGNQASREQLQIMKKNLKKLSIDENQKQIVIAKQLQIAIKITGPQPKRHFSEIQQQRLVKQKGSVKSMMVRISLSPKVPLTSCSLTLEGPSNIYFSYRQLFIKQLNKQQQVQFQVYLDNQKFPSNDLISAVLVGKVGSSYKSFQSRSQLPASFFLSKNVQQQKKAKYFKIQLQVTQRQGSQQLLQGVWQTGAEKCSVQLPNGVKVFMVLSKQQLKIRSQVMQGLAFPLFILSKRLSLHFIDQIPNKNYFEAVQTQLALHQELVQLRQLLQQESARFLLLERSVVQRFKEKVFQSKGIRLMLQEIGQKLIKLSLQLEQTKFTIQVINHKVYILGSMYLKLLGLKHEVLTNQWVLKELLSSSSPHEEWVWRVQQLGKEAGVGGSMNITRIKQIVNCLVENSIQGG